ncbi:MAG TPA: tetratricopeptide repeat protein [Pyrinomonadaceae bacterium]|nr:tetratricopeptide repeat protein [Pyrinomonadaceae bacterium]
MLRQSSLVVLCVYVVLFLLSGAQLAPAQDVLEPGVPPAGSKKAPNPTLPKVENRISPTELKFRDLIKDGNSARNSFDYGKALENYRKASELLPKNELGHYGLGNVYYDVNCYDFAIAFYNRALAIKPAHLDALVQLGNAYLNKERYDEAEAQFTKAIKLHPRSVSAKLARFFVWAKKGKAQEAIDGINQLLDDRALTNSDRALANLALGNVLVTQSKWEESIAPYEKATKIRPDVAEGFVRLGTAQLVTAFSREVSSFDATPEDHRELVASARQASETLRTAIDVKGYEHPAGHLVLAMSLMHQTNYQAAAKRINHYFDKVKELESVLSGLDPAVVQKCDYAWGRLYANGYLQLGHVYERQADEPGANRAEFLNLAVKQYQDAIKKKEDYEFAYTALGNVYGKLRKRREAIEEYKRALRFQTTDARKAGTNELLGIIYSQLGQPGEAIYHLNLAIKLEPQESGAYLTLAGIYNSQKNYDEAIRLYTKVKDLEPRPKASLYSMLAQGYFSRAVKTGNDSDHEKAIELLNEAIKINPRAAYIYKVLGNVYKFYKNGLNAEAALSNYEIAKGLDPNDAGTYFLIGDLHASVTRNYDAAIKNLNEAIRLKPDYALAYWTLAIVYRERKDYDEAVRNFIEGLKYEKTLETYFQLADLYDQQKNYAQAIKWMQEGARHDPENHFPYFHIARFYTHWQKNDEAINFYNEAINRLKPDDSAIKNLYLCRIIRLRRQYQDAVACFEKLSYPVADQVPYELGATYVEAGNKQAALIQQQRLVELKSNLADSLLADINAMKPGQ